MGQEFDFSGGVTNDWAKWNATRGGQGKTKAAAPAEEEEEKPGLAQKLGRFADAHSWHKGAESIGKWADKHGPITKALSGNELNQDFTLGDTHMSLSATEKEQVVNALVVNCGCQKGLFTEADRAVLNSTDDERLVELYNNLDEMATNERIANVVRQGVEEGATNFVYNMETNDFGPAVREGWSPESGKDAMGNPKKKDQEEDTGDENHEGKPGKAKDGEGTTYKPTGNQLQRWMASAPPEVREVVQNAMRLEHKQKQDAITKIVNNNAARGLTLNKMQQEWLAARKLPELEFIANMSANADGFEAEPAAQQMQQRRPVFNFSGAAGGAPVANIGGGADEDEPLVPPTINYKELSAERASKVG